MGVVTGLPCHLYSPGNCQIIPLIVWYPLPGLGLPHSKKIIMPLLRFKPGPLRTALSWHPKSGLIKLLSGTKRVKCWLCLPWVYLYYKGNTIWLVIPYTSLIWRKHSSGNVGSHWLTYVWHRWVTRRINSQESWLHAKTSHMYGIYTPSLSHQAEFFARWK